MARRTKTIAEAIPALWIQNLVPHTKLGLGLDVATTENKKSNPSALSVVEKMGPDFYVRLLLRWKTADPAITEAICRHVLMQLHAAGRKGQKLCIDASSEKFFAVDLRKALNGIIPVDLVVNSEGTKYLGEEMNFKVYLGNLYVNTITDNGGHLILPDEKWVSDDARQVKRDKGTFYADVDENGNHADGFDSVKLGIHAVIGGCGRAEAEGARVGSFGTSGMPGRKLLNPYAKKFERRSTINA